MSRTPRKLPKVSFIIPTLNRQKTIEACLESMVNQEYPNIEIIIVDGGSEDNTLAIASKYATKVIYDGGPLGQARQHGVEESTGELLGVFDSDVIFPTKDWLYKAVQKFNEGSNIGIGFAINRPPKKASIVARCYFDFWEKRLEKGQKVLPGGNSLILRKALAEAGGFDSRLHFGEDLDLTYRIVRLGYKFVVIDPIIHDTMSSLKEFTKKQIWGASSLTSKGQKKTRARVNLFHICMTWRAENESSNSLGTLIRNAFFGHVLIGFQGMISGIFQNRGYSWLIFPILLGIRIGVYGIFLLRKILWRI